MTAARAKSVRWAVPRPFLKWAGGKTQLVPFLMSQVELAGSFRDYHEPFLGGGALFFALCRADLLSRRRAFLSDTNQVLIETYEAVQQELEGLLERLEEHRSRHDKAHYYQVRAEVPADRLSRAARMIYLNRTCYNGLYRVNSKGQFNVPLGRYKNPCILDRENLTAVSRALAEVQLEVGPFDRVLERARPGDLVYFDPPYDPRSSTEYFTAYTQDGFGKAEQERLAEVFGKLTGRGVLAILSNSATDFVRELYSAYTVTTVPATRAINSRKDRRGRVAEVVVRNF